MTAYIIAEITVTDPEGFERYRLAVPPVIAAHGGRYLVRGGAAEMLDGGWSPARLVILAFPDMRQLQAFWTSADYAPLRALRKSVSTARAIAVVGCGPVPQ